MASTRRRYHDNPYEDAFDATVVDARAVEDGFDVVLDQTAFYPESGGQPCDLGELDGAPVVDVREDGETVVHRVRVVSAPSGRVHGRIDRARRFDHMQQHTGQHVLSRAFVETAGLATVAFHLGEAACTIDLEGPAPDDAAVRAAEALANRVIVENRPVTAREVDAADVGSEVRSRVPEGTTRVRLVTVDAFDVSACCGTHVAHTGELRMVRVLRRERVRGHTRVAFVVGERALADYARRCDVTDGLSRRLTTSIDALVDAVEALREDATTSRRALRRVRRRLADLEAQRLWERAAADAGPRVVAEVLEDADAEAAGAVAAAIAARGDAVAVIGAGDGAVVCAVGEGVDGDVTPAIEVARGMGVRGGGRGRRAQWKTDDPDAARRLIDAIATQVRRTLGGRND